MGKCLKIKLSSAFLVDTFAPMSTKYKILYLFESSDLIVAEVKRLDLPEDADLSDVYHWLYLDRISKSMIKLWFRSMDSSSDIEERFFEQGYLKFNNKEATFIEKYNSAQHKLRTLDANKPSEEIIRQIEDYLM